jgi:hypothetical protein
MPLTIPASIDISTHKPIIQFSEFTDPNVCAPININFEKKLYNGG